MGNPLIIPFSGSPQTNRRVIPVATTTNDGAMSADDKTNLDYLVNSRPTIPNTTYTMSSGVAKPLIQINLEHSNSEYRHVAEKFLSGQLMTDREKAISKKILASRLKHRMTKHERQYKHVLASEIAQGATAEDATRIAAAVTNRSRRRAAEHGEGPTLVSEGGSRRQWYPGKRRNSTR